MKIIINGPGDVSILDQEGIDVGEKLAVRSIKIEVVANEFPIALLECYVSEVHASIRSEDVKSLLTDLGVEVEED